MTPVEISLSVALVGILGYAGGKWLFKKDDEWERTAEHLLELSGSLRDYGLRDIPKGLQLAAIKDISGVVSLVKFYIDLLKRDPAAVAVEFDKVFDRVFEAKAKDPNFLASLQARIIKAEAAKS
jgi:hypothetical protein